MSAMRQPHHRPGRGWHWLRQCFRIFTRSGRQCHGARSTGKASATHRGGCPQSLPIANASRWPAALGHANGGDWYQYALNRVAGPAIALIVTGALGGLMNFVGIILNVFNVVVGQGFRGGNVHGDPALAMFSGVGGIVGGIVGLIMALLVIAGAIKMKNLSSYGLAMTAAIVAVIPCVSPCCLLGLPFGIWALVVLNEENVKAAFYQPLLPPG